MGGGGGSSEAVGMRQRGIVAAIAVMVEVSKFKPEPVLSVSTVSIAVSRREAADWRLEQFPNFPGRQLDRQLLLHCFTFTQAQPLQEPDLLHLQHAILSCHFSDGQNRYTSLAFMTTTLYTAKNP